MSDDDWSDDSRSCAAAPRPRPLPLRNLLTFRNIVIEVGGTCTVYCDVIQC